MMRIGKISFLTVLLASCGGQSPTTPTLVASFYPIAYLTSRIAGDKYEVHCLVPAGEEPHDFDLRPSGARAIEDADALFLNGLGMEGWADNLSSKAKSKAHVLSEGLDTLSIEGRVDPHVWLDPVRYKEMGRHCMEALCEIDQKNIVTYQMNYGSFAAEIDRLIAHCETLAADFSNKVIAVSHAAFGYMADRFSFKQLYINGVSPDDEPSQKAIEGIMEAVQAYGIDTVFFEELASDDVARRIAEATGAKCESLNPLEGLEQDEIDAGETYFSVYKENMRKIAEAKP